MNLPDEGPAKVYNRPDGEFDYPAWEQANNRFLEAALAWLRISLRQYAQTARPPIEAPRGGRFERRPAGASPGPTNEVALARQRMLTSAAEAQPSPALILLVRRFGLSEFEQDLLLLCAGLELDPSLSALCAEVQGGLPNPTFALARSLFNNPSWEAFSPQRPLRQWRMIEINQPGSQPLTTSSLRADERIVSYIKGSNYIDDHLAPLLIPFDQGGLQEGDLPDSQQETANTIARRLQRFQEDGDPVLLIQMAGPDGLSKQLIALEAARQVGTNLFRLPAEWLPTSAAELETLARLWEREHILHPVALFLDASDGPEAGAASTESPSSALPRFLARVRGIIFLDTREVQPELGMGAMVLDIEKPLVDEQVSAWEEVLDEAGEGWAGRLAGQFSLNLPTIRSIAASARAENEWQPAAEPPRSGISGDRLISESGMERDIEEDGVFDGAAEAPSEGEQPDRSRSFCEEPGLGASAWRISLARTRPRLDQLACRIEPKARWEDIELPEEPLGLLHEIVAQVEKRIQVYEHWGLRQAMNRGLGISTLFAGESGVGKTMAAEVIANALCLNLYRIDLSAVVSKYIGETEKNLRRLFDAAEDGGVLLFFDEADALFGKRSEVKDSHDRYANIEVNYLLQRMEAYHGLAILATNMKSALDPAFLRRLRFIVNLPYPGSGERHRIWRKAFPPGVPLDALDYERLARLNLTGGSIHNIAVNAAFLAAAQPAPLVTMERVLQAARTELCKIDRPINEREMEWKLDGPAREQAWAAAFRPAAPWRRALARPTPPPEIGELDHAFLARYELNGGSIANIAARAGEVGRVVTMEMLLELVKRELRAQGKPVDDHGFIYPAEERANERQPDPAN